MQTEINSPGFRSLALPPIYPRLASSDQFTVTPGCRWSQEPFFASTHWPALKICAGSGARQPVPLLQLFVPLHWQIATFFMRGASEVGFQLNWIGANAPLVAVRSCILTN